MLSPEYNLATGVKKHPPLRQTKLLCYLPKCFSLRLFIAVSGQQIQLNPNQAAMRFPTSIKISEAAQILFKFQAFSFYCFRSICAHTTTKRKTIQPIRSRSVLSLVLLSFQGSRPILIEHIKENNSEKREYS